MTLEELEEWIEREYDDESKVQQLESLNNAVLETRARLEHIARGMGIAVSSFRSECLDTLTCPEHHLILSSIFDYPWQPVTLSTRTAGGNIQAGTMMFRKGNDVPLVTDGGWVIFSPEDTHDKIVRFINASEVQFNGKMLIASSGQTSVYSISSA